MSRILDVDDDGVHIVVQRAKLNSAKAIATQQTAKLLVAARQGAGIDEEWTSVDHIRKAAEQKGILDPRNFSKALNALDGQGMRFRGQRSSREIKMNDAGFESAGQLAEALVSEA